MFLLTWWLGIRNLKDSDFYFLDFSDPSHDPVWIQILPSISPSSFLLVKSVISIVTVVVPVSVPDLLLFLEPCGPRFVLLLFSLPLPLLFYLDLYFLCCLFLSHYHISLLCLFYLLSWYFL